MTKLRFTLVAALFAAIATNVAGQQQQLPSAQLSTIFPPGGKAGATFDVAITGKDTDGASKLLFSHPGITGQVKAVAPNEFLPPRPSTKDFTVQIAADVPPGAYDVRVVGKYGASNPRTFVVGSPADAVEKEPNNDAKTAMPLPLDSVVYGNADNEGFDLYKVTLKQGQKIIVDCQGQRLDSKLDPTLAILDGTGRELLRCRDVERRDPMTDFAAPADGDYWLKISDHTYRGGDEYPYRLAVSTAPHVDFVFPPCGQPGAKTRITVFGRNLPGGTPAPNAVVAGRPLEQVQIDVDIPGDAASRQALALAGLVEPDEAGTDGFAWRLPSPQGPSNPVTIGYATAPVIIEQEPNNEADKPQVVTVPCEVAGQFNPKNDSDWYQFEAKKGDVYWIEVLAQRLGNAADPYLMIERVSKNDKGETQRTTIADLDDDGGGRRRGGEMRRRRDPNESRRFRTRTADVAYQFEAPEDGTYRVLVRDLYYRNRGNPRLVYRLSIRPEQPDFRLVAVPLPSEQQQDEQAVVMATPLLRKGGNVAMEVHVIRRDGFGGPIELSVSGLPPGVSAPTARIGDDDTLGIITLVAEATAADWVGEVTITGKATVGGAELVRTARSSAVVTGAQNGNERAQSRLARSIVVSVTASESSPAVVRAGDGAMLEVSRAGKLQIPVAVARTGDFKGPIQLQARGLPQQLGNPNVNVNPDQSSANLELTINPQIAPGVYTFHLQGQTQVANYRRNPEAADAAKKDKEEMDKIAAEVAKASQVAQQAKQAAEQNANTMANMAKQATEAAAAAERERQQAEQQTTAANAQSESAKTNAAAKPEDQNLKNAAATAQKAAEDAAAKLKAAADKKDAAMKLATESAAKSQAAAEAKTAADKAAAEAAAKAQRAEQAKQQTNQRATEADNQAKPKNINFIIYSTPISISVAPAPIKLTLPAPTATIDQNGQAEFAVKIERLFGYNEEVEIDIVKENTRGVESQQVKIPAGQNEGKLVLKANKDAAPGERKLRLEAKMKLNGQNLQLREEITVTVNPKS